MLVFLKQSPRGAECVQKFLDSKSLNITSSGKDLYERIFRLFSRFIDETALPSETYMAAYDGFTVTVLLFKENEPILVYIEPDDHRD